MRQCKLVDWYKGFCKHTHMYIQIQHPNTQHTITEDHKKCYVTSWNAYFKWSIIYSHEYVKGTLYLFASWCVTFSAHSDLLSLDGVFLDEWCKKLWGQKNKKQSIKFIYFSAWILDLYIYRWMSRKIGQDSAWWNMKRVIWFLLNRTHFQS